MSYPIDRKLVVGVSSTALFNLEKEAQIFKEQGVEAFRKHQQDHKNDVLEKGPAFPFVKRFLAINDFFPEEEPVEVVLLSKNSPETGIRVFHSIREHGINVTRGVFTTGKSPFSYIPAYNISLFLSSNIEDVNNAIDAGFAAGRYVSNGNTEFEDDKELRIAFDFDGVIADDAAEQVFKANKNLDEFHEYETTHSSEPHQPGPLADFFKKITYFQKLENKKATEDKTYQKILRTSIITARNAPSHERAINTLSAWGVEVDELFLMGGVDKSRVLNIVKPHIYFDDQLVHLNSNVSEVPLVHIPFGIANKGK